MRIALTGSTGLIGAEVHAALRGHEVVRVGRSSGAELRADLSVPPSVASLDLRGCDALVHCAGVTDGDFAEDRGRAYLHSTAGTAALVDRAVAGGVRRLVYISTAHVYAPLRGHIDESTAPNPLGDYAIAHYAAEQIVRRATSLQTLVLRPCAVFGVPRLMERFDRWSLIPYSFPLEAVTSRKIVLRSTGEQRRNFVATHDIAACIRTWLDADAPPAVMNPVGPDTWSVHEFALACADAYRTRTGETCAIERPSAGVREELDYASIHKEARLRTPVRDYLDDMILTLMKEAGAGRIHGR